MLIIAIDTTSLPSTRPGWTPRIVSVGLARVGRPPGAGYDGHDGPLSVQESDGILVRQDAAHVHHDFAKGAFHANGLGREAIIQAPLGQKQVAAGLRKVLELAEGKWTAFNVKFAAKFLGRAPWNLAPAEECLMVKAAMVIKGTGSGGRDFGKSKTIKMIEAFAWAKERGFQVEEGSGVESRGTSNPGATRSHDKAVRLARLWLALEQLEGDVPW